MGYKIYITVPTISELTHASQLENNCVLPAESGYILDKQIDTLVYELYELTPEEIKIVEGENKHELL